MVFFLFTYFNVLLSPPPIFFLKELGGYSWGARKLSMQHNVHTQVRYSKQHFIRRYYLDQHGQVHRCSSNMTHYIVHTFQKLLASIQFYQLMCDSIYKHGFVFNNFYSKHVYPQFDSSFFTEIDSPLFPDHKVIG